MDWSSSSYVNRHITKRSGFRGMARYRLKETHATFKKMQEVFDKMRELGLEFRIGYAGRLTVIDSSQPAANREFEIRMMDDDGTDNTNISELPPTLDYKLIYEKS